MILRGLIKDIISKYMIIGPFWLLFTYVMTLLFMIITVHWFKKKKAGVGKCLLLIMLFFYLLTVYTSTVLARKKILYDIVQLKPFWSWNRALLGSIRGIEQIIENIIMLMPIGFIMPFLIVQKHYIIKTVLIGFMFSVIIEVSQYVVHVGVFEIDDMINNTLGVIVGCVLSSVLKRIIDK